jgi:hypothetical protein
MNIEKKINYRRGFIKTIIVIIIALIILGWFGFDVESIIKSDKVQKNLNYVWDIVVRLWDNYLAGPVIFVWDKIVVGMLWESLQKIFNH